MNTRGRNARGMPLSFVHTPQIYCVLLYQIITARVDYFSKTILHIATKFLSLRFRFQRVLQSPTRAFSSQFDRLRRTAFGNTALVLVGSWPRPTDVAQKPDLRHREGTLFGALMKNTIRISCSKREARGRVLLESFHRISYHLGRAWHQECQQRWCRWFWRSLFDSGQNTATLKQAIVHVHRE